MHSITYPDIHGIFIILAGNNTDTDSSADDGFNAGLLHFYQRSRRGQGYKHPGSYGTDSRPFCSRILEPWNRHHSVQQQCCFRCLRIPREIRGTDPEAEWFGLWYGLYGCIDSSDAQQPLWMFSSRRFCYCRMSFGICLRSDKNGSDAGLSRRIHLYGSDSHQHVFLRHAGQRQFSP